MKSTCRDGTLKKFSTRSPTFTPTLVEKGSDEIDQKWSCDIPGLSDYKGG